MTDHERPADGVVLHAVAAHARAAAADADSAHDISHLERVVRNARMLLADEARTGAHIDALVVEVAAWLHDLVQVPKQHAAPGESARRSAEAAAQLLSPFGLAPEQVAHICAAIETHSFSGGKQPATLEAAIVQDADRIDALGAIGVARLWATGQAMGGSFYDPADPLATARDLDDKRWGLDHIERKLRKLPQLMQTSAGRALAGERLAVVDAFRAQMLREIGVVASDAVDDDTELDLAQVLVEQRIGARIVPMDLPTPTVPIAAEALGVEPDQIVKSLLFSAPDGSTCLAVLSGGSRVDLAALAAEAGVPGRRLQLAKPAQVLAQTGYAAGGVPPVGYRQALNVIVDARVFDFERVFGGGGRVDLMLEIAPWEIVRACAARVARVRELPTVVVTGER